MRAADDPLAFLHGLRQKPFNYDFYDVLRRLDCLQRSKPRLGTALRPSDEPLRFGQETYLGFAPAPLGRLAEEPGRAPRLEVRFFGLLGPNGPLPLHLTDYARERILHHGDATLARFLDVFHHRLIALFYRAWAQAQPTVSLDRPEEDRFTTYVGALIGIGAPQLRQRDAAGDYVKLFHAGLLARQVRNADGLAALLAGYFCLPVRIEQFVGHWMRLPGEDLTRLGRAGGGPLARSAVLGGRVWDRQHKFRVRLGPLSEVQYESFLPGGSALPRLVALVRQYLGFELDWDANLVLERRQVPPIRLGSKGRLGWTTWVGTRPHRADAADLTLDAERQMHARMPGAQT
jgi:type VI secretion system protein ImpH